MKADTQTIDILLLGSGGREHALAAKLAASPRAGKLYIAPGNGGTASCGENVVLDDCDSAAVAAFAQSHGCGLVVIGPEAPLVAGVADAVRAAGIPCFGPGAEGAQMEGSKLFSKQLMERAGIPTAAYGSFTDEASALATCASRALRWSSRPTVLPRARALSWRPNLSRPRRPCASALAAPLAMPATPWLSRRCSLVPSARCWPLPTARPCVPWPPRRTTSARSRATRAPTPAAWASIARCPS